MSRRLIAALASLVSIASSSCTRSHVPEPVVTSAPVMAAPRESGPVASESSSTTAVSSSTDSSMVREYRGSYSTGFERSWFEPCDAPRGDGLWWVTLTEDARLQRDSLLKLLPRMPTEGLAVRWLATVSPRMRAGAGHMGRGSRYILVTKFIALHPLGSGEPDACGPAGRVG